MLIDYRDSLSNLQTDSFLDSLFLSSVTDDIRIFSAASSSLATIVLVCVTAASSWSRGGKLAGRKFKGNTIHARVRRSPLVHLSLSPPSSSSQCCRFASEWSSNGPNSKRRERLERDNNGGILPLLSLSLDRLNGKISWVEYSFLSAFDRRELIIIGRPVSCLVSLKASGRLQGALRTRARERAHPSSGSL